MTGSPDKRDETPRTDEEVAIAKKFPLTEHGLWISAEFARQLERELAAAKAGFNDIAKEGLKRADEADTLRSSTREITDNEIVRALRDATASDATWRELTREIGPYSITEPRAFTRDFVRLIVERFAPSAIVPKWLVRAGGDCYETWLCSTREDVRHAFMEALYGDVATAQSENTGDIASFMEDFDRRIVEDKDVRWSFEDGWLEVIALNGTSDDGVEKP